MINIETKKKYLIQQLTDLLTNCERVAVHYAEPSETIPRGGNVSSCDRLAVPLSGCHRMEIFNNGSIKTIYPVPGMVTFMSKGIWNRPDWQLAVKTATFGFGTDSTWISLVECCDGESRHGTRIIVPALPSEGRELLQIVNLMYRSGCNDARSELLVTALLYFCLDLLLMTNDSLSQSKAAHTWQLIAAYLEEHYATDISRELVARMFQLAPNYISFLARQQTGSRFIEYLHQLRLTKAGFLLKNYTQTLDEIAFAVGFSSTAYFCRLFKRYYNMTPTAYRNHKS